MDLSIIPIFFAGVLSFFTPCILPLIPVYIGIISGNIENKDKNAVVKSSLSFSFGFIVSFALIGGLFAIFGLFLSRFQSIISIITSFIIFIFGLKFLGIIKIQFFEKTFKLDHSKVKTKFKSLNNFLLGFIFGTGWSPCIGPILGSILTFVLSKSISPFLGFLYLFVYGLGLFAPFILVSIFSEALLPKIKSIYKHFKKIEIIIGVLMIVSSIYLFSTSFNLNVFQTNNAEKHDIKSFILNTENKYPTLVEFYSSNCGICKNMEPIIDKIFTKCDGNKINLKKIDISKSENLYLKNEFNIIGVPTFILLDKDNKEVSRLIGEQTENAIYQAIATLRGEKCDGVSLIFEGNTDNNSCSSSK